MDLPNSKTLTARNINGLVYYTFPALDALDFVRHGVSTRLGGASRSPYDAMNLSFGRGDDPDAVGENFRRFCAALGGKPEDVVLSRQEHHVNIRNVTAVDRGKGVTRERDYTDVDGLITDEPGILLCTQYADCVPLLFADPVKKVVAASHAGWKGTAAGIGRVTVEKMRADYGCDPGDMMVGIAPSIGPCCFEVDAPVLEAFQKLAVFDEGCFTAKPHDKYMISLWEVNRRSLVAAGVRPGHITVTDLCTRCRPDLFWSHRAAGDKRGSLAAMIGVNLHDKRMNERNMNNR